MQTTHTQLFRTAGAFTATALALASAPLSAADKSDAFPTFDSYIKVSGQKASITGDGAAFQSRTGQSEDYGVGIEDLHYAKELNKDTSITVDGRALTGTEDYLLKLNVAKNEFGSVDAGYKRFRTFYDGVGGFFPRNQAWFPLADRDLHVDRGEFWVEAKLAMKDAPEFTISYRNATRDGKKDSTIWGDTDLTGIPNNTPPVSTVRKIIPSFLGLDERHQELEATMKHTVGNTTLELSVFADWVKNVDTRYVTRFPGEARPWPTPTAKFQGTTLMASNKLNNQVIMRTVEGNDSKSTGFRASTLTVLNPKISLKTGFKLENVDNTFSGDRPLFTTTPSPTGIQIIATNNNLDLSGTSSAKVYVGTIGVDLNPTKNLAINVGVKGEDSYVKSEGKLTSVAATGTPAVTITKTNQIENSRAKEHSLTPELGIRYTGISDLALYASGSQKVLNGDERYNTPYNPVTSPVIPPAGNTSFQNPSENHADYKLGANWRQSALLTVRGEVFYKNHENKYTGYWKSSGDYYLLGAQFKGGTATAIVRPAAPFTFTSRYSYQTGKRQVTGYIPTVGKYDSEDFKSHILSETIDWTPSNQIYVQASGNLVFNVINTIYPRAGITLPVAATSAAAAQQPVDINGVLQNSNNNYMTASVVAGFVASKTDDVQFRFNYYSANNGDAKLHPLTLPYGVDASEYSVTLGVKHKLTDRLVAEAKAGYMDGKNDTTGGYTNYHGPLVYVSVQYGL